MNVYKYCNRELTEKENDMINHFTYYVASKDPFCLISENTVIVFKPDDIDGKTDEEIEEFALDNINEMLSSHPDFTSFIMDTEDNIIILDVRTEVEADELDFVTALTVRGNILCDCENNGVLALVKPE